MTASLVAITDTCSIFPQTLRDVLLRAAEAGLYRLRWSEEILHELGRNLRADRGLTEEQTRHLLTEMRRAFPDATVAGYERLIGDMKNHPKDRHVLAAAVHAAAQVIVTDNLSDFPHKALEAFNTEAWTPDEFLGFLFDRHPDEMARIVTDLNAARRKPSEALSETLDRLAKSAPHFVARVRKHPAVAHRIEGGRVEAFPQPVVDNANDLPPGHARARLDWAGRTYPTMTLVSEWGEDESSEIEEMLFDQIKRNALGEGDITEVRLKGNQGEILHVAVVNVAQRPDFATLHNAHPGEETVTLASKWTIFAKREYACLQIEAVTPVPCTFVMGFSGRSRLESALAINRQGRFSTTSRTPATESDVLAAGLVWTFPYSPQVEASLSRMIQQSAQGTISNTNPL